MSSMHVVIKRLLKGVAVVFFLGGGGDSFLYICKLHYIHIVFSCFFFNEILHLN